MKAITTKGHWVQVLRVLAIPGLVMASLVQAAGNKRVDEVEQAVVRMWAEHKSMVCRFTETRNLGADAGYNVRIEGIREIVRDGEQTKSRGEAVEYAVVSIDGKEQSKEIKRTLTVCSGTHRIAHVAGQDTAKRFPADNCDDPVKMFQWLRRIYEMVLEPEEKINDEVVYVLGARAPGLPINEWLLYYSKDGVLVKQVKLGLKSRAAETVLTYTDIKFDSEVDAGRFVFTPPEGVTIKDVERGKD